MGERRIDFDIQHTLHPHVERAVEVILIENKLK